MYHRPPSVAETAMSAPPPYPESAGDPQWVPAGAPHPVRPPWPEPWTPKPVPPSVTAWAGQRRLQCQPQPGQEDERGRPGQPPPRACGPRPVGCPAVLAGALASRHGFLLRSRASCADSAHRPATCPVPPSTTGLTATPVTAPDRRGRQGARLPPPPRTAAPAGMAAAGRTGAAEPGWYSRYPPGALQKACRRLDCLARPVFRYPRESRTRVRAAGRAPDAAGRGSRLMEFRILGPPTG